MPPAARDPLALGQIGEVDRDQRPFGEKRSPQGGAIRRHLQRDDPITDFDVVPARQHAVGSDVEADDTPPRAERNEQTIAVGRQNRFALRLDASFPLHDRAGLGVDDLNPAPSRP